MYGANMKDVVDSVDGAVPVTASVLAVVKVVVSAAVALTAANDKTATTRSLIFCRTEPMEEAR